MANIEEKIGYKFSEPKYLALVLKRTDLNERRDFRILAIYGDAIIKIAACEYLISKEPVFKTGKKIFHDNFGERLKIIIADDTFLTISNKMELALTADQVEALIGAIYKDSRFEKAKEVAMKLISEELAEI